ncbi:heme ABC transporter ATP-binding protein [Aureimonas flava]|uniref:Heme ABC transporter ATP-binding protein n=1 Tax=Aureimonas flava TaxID=2320271 RepID=A0A3A1WH78_9HYPH|nr:heme ABC transporter ATP-binding protein [Aureimonas flava]RIX98183.1 heme ABC transporter ATP-binding protein [Aureimonas flava]
MITLEDAAVGYRARTALHPTSLAIASGTFTVVVGPNGAGKSTLLKVMTGEIAPQTGRVRLDAEPLGAVPPRALARRRAVLPQSSALAFPFTVAEIVRLGLEAGGRADGRDAIVAALARVDLAGFSGRTYQELSGGEQQRVHLARVLCQIGEPVENGQPHFLFLDEPISSLDIRHQIAVLRIAREFADQGGGVLAVLHDLNLAAGFADRILVLADGRVIGDGSPAEVLTDALIERAFGLPLRVGALPAAGIPFILPQTAA